MNQSKSIALLTLLLGALFLSSCGPVHLLTQAKRVPRKHSENYNHPNVKSLRSEANQRAWVVYSDRAGQSTTIKPGGTLAHTELQFMEPLLVIGRRGNDYKLIKYDPAVLDNERLTNRSAVEYVGWLHKDRLLLFDNALTEIRNNIKLKKLTAITDGSLLLEPARHFASDSLVLHSRPNLEEPCGTTGLNEIVYALKYAENDTRVLVAPKTRLHPAELEGMPVGWIDASLAAPFGQRLMLVRPPMVVDSIGTWRGERYRHLHQTVSPVALSPVLYANRVDSVLLFRTLDAVPVIDPSDNQVYNVDAGVITHSESNAIAARLRDIHVVFAFDPTPRVVELFPMISNAMQNMKAVFDSSPEGINHRFGAVIGQTVLPFTGDYLSFSDRVIETSREIAATETNPEQTLALAAALAGKHPQATNIVVLVGEQTDSLEPPSQALLDKIIDNNCRLLSFQVYAENDDAYNNFVLHASAIVEAYAEIVKTTKRQLIVYPDQLRSENRYVENAKNAYALDFPAHSMTQGMVIFPEKGRYAELQLLTDGVDSLVRQVEADNLTLIASLHRAFSQVGSHRNRYDDRFAEHVEGIAAGERLSGELKQVFPQTAPLWTSVTNRVFTPIDSLHLDGFRLLLTEQELADVLGFVEKLSAVPLDLKGQTRADPNKARRVSRVRRALRGVPVDAQPRVGHSATDTTARREYVQTGRSRRHLHRTYMRSLKGCVIQGRKRHLSLARAQEYITTAPTANPELNRIAIKDLRRKQVLTHEQLDELIQYFGARKESIGSQVKPADELNAPQGDTHFVVPVNALP